MTRVGRFLQPTTCFACGTDNPQGLHVSFRQTHSGAEAIFVPGANHEGWPGVVHGGILATLLDEAMAYAVWFSEIHAVTARMETRFRRVVGAGQELIISGEVLAQRRGLVDAVGRIILLDGSLVAEASARFVPADVSY